MARFNRDLLLFALLQLLVLGGWLAWRYSPSVVYPFYRGTALKHQRMGAAPSPRMILVGGSNLLYGIHSELIEQETGYHPVNMGLIGGVGLEFMLREVADEVQHGDLVVLSLEYHRLTSPRHLATPQVLMRVIEQWPANLQYLSFPHWRSLLDHGALEHLGIILRSNKRDPRWARSRKWTLINAYGDLISFRDTPPPPNHGIAQQTVPPRLLPKHLSDNIERLNSFAAHCEQRGARMVYSYPPLPQSQFTTHRKVIEAYDRRLRQTLQIPILHDQARMVFLDEHFIKVSYHLHGIAITQRTERLITAIKAYETETPTSSAP